MGIKEPDILKIPLLLRAPPFEPVETYDIIVLSLIGPVPCIKAIPGTCFPEPTIVQLKAIGSDTRVGSKYLKYGYGFGGPCLPRDNRSFAAYAKKLGLEYNLGKTTDDFNNEHAKFLKNYFTKKNSRNLPFAFHYISYKDGTDILTESQQYRLCLDLLDSGYKVYVLDNLAILDQVREYLETKYGDRVVVNGIPNEEVYWIDL